jgi:phosphoribosylanthranilate isomerase
MEVKICGVTREEDALLAARCGADAIGLLVGQRHNSPDFISADLAARIRCALPASIEPVLVTHIPEVDDIERLLDVSGLKTVQLHSEISADAIRDLRKRLPSLRVFKLVHVVGLESVDYPESFRHVVDGFVLDSVNVSTDQVGGTGKVHDWSISREIVSRYNDVRFFLAGGLNAQNVRAAVDLVKPFGVDVNSGTKGVDGFRDPRKMEEFIRRAKEGDLQSRQGQRL